MDLCEWWIGFKGRVLLLTISSNEYDSVVCQDEVSVGVLYWVKGIVPGGVDTPCERVVKVHHVEVFYRPISILSRVWDWVYDLVMVPSLWRCK